MTREEFANKFHWSRIIWIFGLINVVAMLPQLWQIITTHETAGLNLGTIWTYFVIQTALSINGFIRRDTMLMWCFGLSAAVSMAIIAVTLYLRNQF